MQLNVPMIFKGTFTLASEVHSYITRLASILNFHQPRINTNYGAITFAFARPKIWEKIPSKSKKNKKKTCITAYKQCKLYLLNTEWVILFHWNCKYNFMPFRFFCLCYTLFKCLRQLVTRGSDQLESQSSFAHCAHSTFDFLCNLMLFYFTFVMYCIFFCSKLLK